MKNYSDERKNAICARLQEIEENRNNLISEMNIIQLRLDEMSFLRLYYMEKLEEINNIQNSYEKHEPTPFTMPIPKPTPYVTPVITNVLKDAKETPKQEHEEMQEKEDVKQHTPLFLNDDNLKRWDNEDKEKKEVRTAKIVQASITQQNNELKKYGKGYATEEIRSLVFDYLKENGIGGIKEMYNALDIERFMSYKSFCNIVARLASNNIIVQVRRGKYSIIGTEYKKNIKPPMRQKDVLEYIKMILEEKTQVKAKDLHTQIENLSENESLNIGSLYFYLSTWTKEGVLKRQGNGFYSLA